MDDEAQYRCELGAPGPLRDLLVAAVLSGAKTATTSLLAEWELQDEPLPEPSERQTVIDSDSAPVAEIELVAVEVISLGDVGLELAVAEGEGFETVAEWRAAHEEFWADVVLPELAAGGAAVVLSDETAVVAEWFRVVARPSGEAAPGTH